MARDPSEATVCGSGEGRLAAQHLEAHGYEVVARNFRTRFGELDLIARDERFLVFCEVKTRICALAAPHQAGPRGQTAKAVGPLASMARASGGGSWWPGAGSRPVQAAAPRVRFASIGLASTPSGDCSGSLTGACSEVTRA